MSINNESKDVKKANKKWEKSVNDKGKTKISKLEKSVTNISGIEIEKLYTPLHTKKTDYLKDIGFPGEHPYTRGIYPSMYRGKPWTMRQFAGIGTAEETNHRFKYLLKKGQMGLSVAFDLPTLMGCDSDSPNSVGEVGRCGVAIDTLEDMDILFRGYLLKILLLQ